MWRTSWFVMSNTSGMGWAMASWRRFWSRTAVWEAYPWWKILVCAQFLLFLYSQNTVGRCVVGNIHYTSQDTTTLYNCFLFLLYIIILPHHSFCHSVSHFPHFSIWSISYHIIYHLFSFHRSVQDYIIHVDVEIIIVAGIKGWHQHKCVQQSYAYLV